MRSKIFTKTTTASMAFLILSIQDRVMSDFISFLFTHLTLNQLTFSLYEVWFRWCIFRLQHGKTEHCSEFVHSVYYFQPNISHLYKHKLKGFAREDKPLKMCFAIGVISNWNWCRRGNEEMVATHLPRNDMYYWICLLIGLQTNLLLSWSDYFPTVINHFQELLLILLLIMLYPVNKNNMGDWKELYMTDASKIAFLECFTNVINEHCHNGYLC